MRYGGWDRVSAFGCGKQLIETQWEYTPPFPSPYATMCTYAPAIGSWAHCIDQITKENSTEPAKSFADAVFFINVVCEKAGGNLHQFTIEEFSSQLANATNFLKDAPLNSTKLVSYPINLDPSERRTLIRGVRAEFLNLDESNSAGLWLYYYFTLVLLVYTLFPLLKRWVRGSRAWSFFNGKFLTGTSFSSTKHSQQSKFALGGWIPTAEELLILGGFMVVHFLALICNYSIDPFEILEPVNEQIWQALGNRSGIVAFAQLPILILFTTRSALLMKLTNLKYSTFILLHRWIGRVIIVDSIIHSIAFYVHERMGGALGLVSLQYWWWAGIIATAVCCLIGVMGTGAFRSRFYETFLYTHIVFAIIFFYECWRHAESFGWLNWLKISICLWIMERVYRLLLIFKNGVVVATLDVDNCTSLNRNHDGEQLLTLRLPRPKNWHMRASQYAFVYFMLPSTFWQSHPFTVTCEDGNTLKLVIAVKSGATKSLQRTLLNNMETSPRVTVLLEGPYGVPPSVDKFDSLLLISGGTGVPGPLALALTATNSIDVSNIRLVVVVRDWAILDAYRTQLKSIKESGIKLDIYYTGKCESNEWPAFTEIHYGRPNVKGILEDVLKVQQRPDLGVVCCGPPGLNDMARNIVADAIVEHPETSIEFCEEYQVW